MNTERATKLEKVSTISNITFLILFGREGSILSLKLARDSFPC
jgi:hypothetical protein